MSINETHGACCCFRLIPLLVTFSRFSSCLSDASGLGHTLTTVTLATYAIEAGPLDQVQPASPIAIVEEGGLQLKIDYTDSNQPGIIAQYEFPGQSIRLHLLDKALFGL